MFGSVVEMEWFTGIVKVKCDNFLSLFIKYLQTSCNVCLIIFDEQKSVFIICSSYLINRGVQKGDRILIYMPMIPEALIAMYASARIGAIHSVVFGGFAGNELSKRIAVIGKSVYMLSISKTEAFTYSVICIFS